jgi:hypothetical protein
MTDVIVTQEDREAAAKWAKLNSRHAQAANIRRGSCDAAPIVQAFASHRIKAALAMQERAAKACEQHGETAGAHGPALATRTAIASAIRNLEVPE